MTLTPLMPMATAVWLVENTTLTFKQIADFCNLHEVEVQGIADGEVAKGIKAYNPITSGQLTKEEIEFSKFVKLVLCSEVPVVDTLAHSASSLLNLSAQTIFSPGILL